MTALHCAALEGSVKIAKMLIDAGACLRCFDEEGMTPLHFAAMEGSLDVAQYLFEIGKDLARRALAVSPFSPPPLEIRLNQYGSQIFVSKI